MALSDDSAAIAAGTLTAAVVQAESAGRGAKVESDPVGHVMDVYRRSLNVVRNAAAGTPK